MVVPEKTMVTNVARSRRGANSLTAATVTASAPDIPMPATKRVIDERNERGAVTGDDAENADHQHGGDHGAAPPYPVTECPEQEGTDEAGDETGAEERTERGTIRDATL